MSSTFLLKEGLCVMVILCYMLFIHIQEDSSRVRMWYVNEKRENIVYATLYSSMKSAQHAVTYSILSGIILCFLQINTYLMLVLYRYSSIIYYFRYVNKVSVLYQNTAKLVNHRQIVY